MTTNLKAEQYSANLCNQSGKYTKGEIETAYVTGYNDAEQQAIQVLDMYLRHYLQLDQSEQRYITLMDDFKNFMGGTIYNSKKIKKHVSGILIDGELHELVTDIPCSSCSLKNECNMEYTAICGIADFPSGVNEGFVNIGKVEIKV